MVPILPGIDVVVVSRICCCSGGDFLLDGHGHLLQFLVDVVVVVGGGGGGRGRFAIAIADLKCK